MKVSKNINVHGRVQGVGFRYATLLKATSLGLAGFVKNKTDGSVYIEAEGEDKNMLDFISWCRKGPPLAKVTELHIQDSPHSGLQKFHIR